MQLSNLVVIKAACERVTLNGRLRLTMRPLSPQLPLFGAGAHCYSLPAALPAVTADLPLGAATLIARTIA